MKKFYLLINIKAAALEKNQYLNNVLKVSFKDGNDEGKINREIYEEHKKEIERERREE